VSSMKNYRKTVVSSMPFLTYLDERPVFEDERRLINAWCVLGSHVWKCEEQMHVLENERRLGSALSVCIACMCGVGL